MQLCRNRQGVASERVPRPHGFTLIELLVVISVVAILLMFAAPSLVTFVQKNRIVSEVSTFSADLKFARSEAMKRGQSVSLCPSSDGATCLGANSWQSGWIVFYDLNSTGAVDAAGDTVVRYRKGWTGGDTFVATPNLIAVTFGRIGFASNLSGRSVTLTAHAQTASAQTTQCVLLNPVGRQTVQTAGSGACT